MDPFTIPRIIEFFILGICLQNNTGSKKHDCAMGV